MVTLPPVLSPWRHRTSKSMRWALLAYFLIIVYASLHPLSGWRDTGAPAWAFLQASWPRYWTLFDVFTNWLVYVPLGALIVWSLHPRLRWGAWVLATLVGAALSCGLESLQIYLPNRVSSNLDFLFNTLGALSGAWFGVATARGLIDHGRLRRLRLQWFEREASAGLVLMLAWFAAQLHPQALAFTTGQFVDALLDWWSMTSVAFFWADGLINFNEQQRWTAEIVASSCAFGGAVVLFLSLIRPQAPRLALLLGFGVLAVVVKSLGAATLVGIGASFDWATPNAQMGFMLGLGFAMVIGLIPARLMSSQAQRRCAGASLIVGVFLSNVLPENPYYLASLAQWQQGAWMNFNGLLNVLAIAWPFIAIVYLYRCDGT